MKVYISGPVKYGDNTYRVASYGHILNEAQLNDKKVLVCIDMIDGDVLANAYVDRKYIEVV